MSVDESGKLVVWDLSIHRPVKEFQAHTSQIISVRQMGIKGFKEDGQIEIDSDYFGMILTHGRDHAAKFWNLFDSNGKFIDEDSLVYELPVNALNFSNVDIMGRYLLTPNTTNSEAFDVYDIGFLSKEHDIDDTRLKRLFESVDAYRYSTDKLKRNFEEFKVQTSDESDVNRTGKFGIIMKLIWVKDNIAFIGYESGHVAQIKLDLTEGRFDIISISRHHFPDPVLSLTYDYDNSTVISTSIRSEVAIHEIGIDKSSLVPLSKGFGKISSVAFIGDKYVFSSWKGMIQFYKLDKESFQLRYDSSFKKPRGMIAGNLNIIGNLNQDDDVKSKNKLITKPNALALRKKSSIATKLHNRRDMKTIQSDFLAVGYDDGTVMVYNEI